MGSKQDRLLYEHTENIFMIVHNREDCEYSEIP